MKAHEHVEEAERLLALANGSPPASAQALAARAQAHAKVAEVLLQHSGTGTRQEFNKHVNPEQWQS